MENKNKFLLKIIDFRSESSKLIVKVITTKFYMQI